jgi:protease IV
MKQFFKFMFASLLGFIIGSFLLFFLMLGMVASIASLSKRDSVTVSPKSVLHLSFESEVVDRGGQNPLENADFLSLSLGRTVGLNDIINNLKKAAEDENIEGVFLDLGIARAGWATISEIRQALQEFRESGKFIVSYGEAYTQNAYYLASVADKIYLHPEGGIDFRGLNAELMFFKNMLDRLGIDAQVVRHGKFKSAGEPFFLEGMSDENRQQITEYIGSIWNNLMGDIAESRGLTINKLNQVADEFLTRNPTLAMEWGMIDGIRHRDEVYAEINELLGIEGEEKPELIALGRYARAPLPKSMVVPRSRDKVAVIYASGNILPGKGGEQTIGSAGMAEAIRQARLDPTVKAIVFRINSPGGSAMASDVILREIRLAAEEKTVIASMGDVAASGGYYIACAADLIVASPTTITGSIGVFGMIPNMQDFFNQKLGITFDNVKTNEFADLATVTRPLTQTERDLIQEEIERVYETFIGHVADGRNMPVSAIDELGQGRVWSGSEARNIGLVDEFGGLSHAIERAVEMAGLETYRIVEYPARKDFLTRLMEDFGGIQERMIEKRLGIAYRYYKQVEEINQMTGILARMPYDIILE